MIDYGGLRAVGAVVQTGSFEKAAKLLHVTPSAVSQRVKALEDRLGFFVIQRGTPCIATEKGEWLCRHLEQVGLLEQALLAQLPGLARDDGPSPRVTLHIAVNADSLATWFLDAVAQYTRETGVLLDVTVDEEGRTADWLAHGRVIAAVTSREQPVSGCRRIPLGALRYLANASPDFAQGYFAEGLTEAAFTRAPVLAFNRHDTLQSTWLKALLKTEPDCPTHCLPSTNAFLDACLAGIGWCMNPVLLAQSHIASGALIDLAPGRPLDMPLYWQVNRLAADLIAPLTRAVTAAAKRKLTELL
ncbi:LysR family transcriptional regulator ArgP [Acidisoma silvae]|uniref:LysR family transcriptional regulator ArgP n=1 Tax=Acidisoma silvae TaxID=2802396 RepID=A0A963YUB3_9PROT|nr:LysR family transcriptional regulator ArgP [Acidisoma silvae]MCB8877210.1 LysR family transcriptional regulator ArgP [Acidisoma silvae]